MTEESTAQPAGQGGATEGTAEEMAEALESLPPELAAQAKAAGITPQDLAEAHDRVTSEQPAQTSEN